MTLERGEVSTERVDLPGTNISTTRLGFGCASLGTRTSIRDGIRLLEQAFDHGIRHFDMARSYGWGQAEGIVGRFAEDRRDEIVLVSKCGILPPDGPLFRAARAVSGTLTARAASGASSMFGRASPWRSTVTLTPESLRSSVEASLRELRTDHLDIILLHSDLPHDAQRAEVLSTLQSFVASGKARAFGISTGDASLVEKLTPTDGPVLQLPLNVFTTTVPQGVTTSRAVIGHSPFGGRRRLRDVLRRVELLELLPSATGRDADAVAELMLAYALRFGGAHVVVSSMLSAEHVRRNCALVDEARYSDDELLAFATSLREVVRRRDEAQQS